MFQKSSSEKRRCFCRQEIRLSKAALSLYDLAVASFVDGPTIWNLGLFREDFSIWVIIPHGVIRFIELKFSVSMGEASLLYTGIKDGMVQAAYDPCLDLTLSSGALRGFQVNFYSCIVSYNLLSVQLGNFGSW